MQTKSTTQKRVAFQALPADQIVIFKRPQYCQIALYLFEQRERGRKVTTRELVLETDIDQAQARLSEMRRLGFVVNTVAQICPRSGDQRKLYILADNIVRVGEADGGSDAT